MEQRINNSTIYNAGLYCRFSKDEGQIGDSSSIQTQKCMLEDYCQNNGFLVHDFYVDDGFSGLNFNRLSFERMLNDIDQGKINMVITKDLSRLGRDYIQSGYYTEIYFQNKKVRYIAVNDGFDSNKDDNDIAPFKHILNDMYSKDLSRKVKSAKRQRMKNGYYISGQTPYGYKVNPDNRNQLIVDEEAAEVVKQIYNLSLAGYSAKKIAQNLTETQILTPGAYKLKNGDTRFTRHVSKHSETKWGRETVQLILKDRVYMGDMENHKSEKVSYKLKKYVNVPKNQRIVVEDTHEAIISREDWNKVQQLINTRHKQPHNNFENLFRGVVYCLDCGCKLNLQSPVKNGKRYHNYRCNQHYLYPEKCLKPHQITYGNLYNIVLERVQKLAKLMRDDDSLMKLIRQKTAGNTKADKLTAQKGKAEKRMNELSRLLRKLFEDNAKGLLDDHNYEVMMGEYQAEQAALTGTLAGIKTQLTEKEDYAGQLEKLQGAVADCLDIKELTPLVLNKLIDRIEVGSQEVVDGQRQQEIRIVWRFAGEV
jgi:DNA invertase Pin-like site-specific DNA recombinase